MIAEPAPGRATEAADSLSIPDCAFVKRSDGSFSHARLAYCTAQSSEEYMAFLLNDTGSTKLTRKSQWSEYVRLISEDVEQTKHSTSLNAARTSSVQQEETRYVNKSNDRNNNHRVKSDNEVGACPSFNLTQQNQEQISFVGFREDYILGQTARSPSHMIAEQTSEKATEAINSLSKHDFAFIKRSDGSFTYSILAFRSDDDDKSDQLSEECMTFVINKSGSSKMLKRSQWSEFVGLVSSDNGSTKDPTLPATANMLMVQQDKIERARGSDGRDDDCKVKPNNGVEDYVNKVKTEFYRVRGPANVGDYRVPPSTILLDAAEDDLISCISTSSEFPNECLETAKYALSQPAIFE